MKTALGFRAHSGWAAMIAAAGTLEAPCVLQRRRIVTAAPDSRQPYHAAADLPLDEARALLDGALASSRALALQGVSEVVRALRSRGHEAVAAGVLCGSGKALPDVEKILAAHPLIHTAEGILFREVLAWAVEECGLRMLWVPEKGIEPASLRRFERVGKEIGPPWTQDQKYATAAAFRALAG
jgi:hypothetical protein